jgi:putative transposase
LEAAAKKIEDFRRKYNHFRPHSSINDVAPKEFIIFHENIPETQISIA